MSSYVKPQGSKLHSPYTPALATIERVVRLTEREKLFTVIPQIHREDGQRLHFYPGQFFMVGIAGYGEAPISISAGDGVRFELCIRAAGNVTNAMHRLGAGESFWIRGPFGRGFNTEELRGRDIVFIAGGIGMVPMRSLIKAVLEERASYGSLTLLYGAKTPSELLFLDEVDEWASNGLEARLTIDESAPGWDGSVGVITTLIPGVDIDETNTTAVVIGPPVMYKFVAISLAAKRVEPKDILVSLERRMKCGLGKCGHCQVNNLYSCQEGPVFRMSELAGCAESM